MYTQLLPGARERLSLIAEDDALWQRFREAAAAAFCRGDGSYLLNTRPCFPLDSVRTAGSTPSASDPGGSRRYRIVGYTYEDLDVLAGLLLRFHHHHEVGGMEPKYLKVHDHPAGRKYPIQMKGRQRNLLGRSAS